MQPVSSDQLAKSTDTEIDDYLRQFAGGGDHDEDAENNNSAAHKNGSATTAAVAAGGAGPPLRSAGNTLRANQQGG